MRFVKMHGIGNDYVYVDCFQNPTPIDPSAVSQHVSKRHYSIGADGLILIEPSEVADAAMRVFNADGSEAEMCGNGIRCVAKYVHDAGICPNDSLSIETKAGIKRIQLTIENGVAVAARVDMGVPVIMMKDKLIDILGESLHVTGVDMGNPHAITFVDALPQGERFFVLGAAIECDAHFPNKTNAEFVQVTARNAIAVRVWERGSGETLACGTGACASLVAAVVNGHCDRKVTVALKGGALMIEWNEMDGHVYMEGPATVAFVGEVDV